MRNLGLTSIGQAWHGLPTGLARPAHARKSSRPTLELGPGLGENSCGCMSSCCATAVNDRNLAVALHFQNDNMSAIASVAYNSSLGLILGVNLGSVCRSFRVPDVWNFGLQFLVLRALYHTESEVAKIYS